MSNWISVKNKFPNNIVLAINGNKDIFIAEYYNGLWKISNNEVYDFVKFNARGKFRITHWQPLPEQPKETHA